MGSMGARVGALTRDHFKFSTDLNQILLDDPPRDCSGRWISELFLYDCPDLRDP